MVGYKLSEDAAVTADYVTFPGFPGRFLPGEALSLQHLGVDEETADDIISALELPLEKVEMNESDATREIDRGDNFAPSSRGAVTPERQEAAMGSLEGMSHAELDEMAEGSGVELAPGMNKAEKASALAEAGVEPQAEESEG